MAITAVDVGKTRDYIAKNDPDRENPTVWKLGILDARIKSYLEDAATSFEFGAGGAEGQAKTTLNLNAQAVEIVRFGLKGFSNFVDVDGKEVKFDTIARAVGGKSYNVVAESVLSLIPYNTIKELAKDIQKDNEFSEQEEKN